ncbi:hypothetical protein PM082_004644 [Marasmius tenuissimus]|nr:hypothetical protein PM082_004644 [Marasmius tenuissimus]
MTEVSYRKLLVSYLEVRETSSGNLPRSPPVRPSHIGKHLSQPREAQPAQLDSLDPSSFDSPPDPGCHFERKRGSRSSEKQVNSPMEGVEGWVPLDKYSGLALQYMLCYVSKYQSVSIIVAPVTTIPANRYHITHIPTTTFPLLPA